MTQPLTQGMDYHPNPQSPSEDETGNLVVPSEEKLWKYVSPEFQDIQTLKELGFCHLVGKLSTVHCEVSLNRIRSFCQDVSNVSSDDQTFLSSNHPKHGFISGFGAGWLLGEIREAIAERVFEPLFGTRCLLSSNEGFRFYSSASGISNVFQVPTSGDKSNSSSIFIRSLVLLSTGPRESLTCNILSSSLSDSNKRQAVQLSKGDILLFRSDFQVEEEFPATLPFAGKHLNETMQSAVMYCTMHPADDSLTSTKKFRNMKIEAYKQRCTLSYQIDQDIIMPTSFESGRCYFRLAPPILSKRLAELHGLLPYNSLDSQDDLKRLKIRGVCFDDDEYEELPEPVSPACRAQSLQLTSKDPQIMKGQDKYLGGMASPCGRFIYGVPGTARRLLRICTSTNVMDCIGPSFAGKFKWLRGVEIPSSSMNVNSKDYPNGCCIALPCNHLSFLKVNPANDKVYIFGTEVLENACQGVEGWYYHGGNLASNGWIYCIPANANRVAKLNPATDEVVLIGPSFEGRQKWYGGLIGSDGCIYGIPHNATTVLRIDPSTDEVSVVEGTDRPLADGNWKWHGGLTAGDKIIGFPNNADTVLVIDCKNSRVYTIGGPHILKSGRHRIPQDGRYKYLGGALTQDARYAYLFPCDAERVLRIDCLRDELSLVGPCLLDGENKFQNGFAAQDGSLYGIPQRAVGVLRIVPGKDVDGSSDHVEIIPCGENMMDVKDKFEGGVLGQDGCIYCIPLRARACVKIVPEDATDWM